MTFSPLAATHKVTIVRRVEAPVDDVSGPVATDTTLVVNQPCRFDRGHGRTILGLTKDNRVVGRLFLDAGLKTQGGQVLDNVLDEKCLFTISGETGEWAADSIDRVFGAYSIHHFEIDLVDHKPS